MTGKSRLTNNVRALRFGLDSMTQKELAERVGVSRQTIIAIEKNKYSPSLELGFKIAAVLQQGIGEVFNYKQ